MMKTKLNHCTSRTLPRDLEDLQFLITNYADEVRAIADELDENDREFFLDLNFVRAMEADVRASFREVLRIEECGGVEETREGG
jgi:hypothetical protein